MVVNSEIVCESYDSTASAVRVWELLADINSYPKWGIWSDARLESGTEHTKAGSIRKMRSGLVTVRERILRVVPGLLIEYELLSGLPVRDYVAATQLERFSYGCRIMWSAQFTPLLPGTSAFFRKQFGALFRDLLERLAMTAESVGGVSA